MSDNRHPEWPEVRRKCEQAIETARNHLETQGMDPVTTEFERGQISAYRAILSLTQPAPDITADTSIRY